VLYDFDGEGPGEITIRSAFRNSKTRIHNIILYGTNFNGQVPLLLRRYGTRYKLRRTSLFAYTWLLYFRFLILKKFTMSVSTLNLHMPITHLSCGTEQLFIIEIKYSTVPFLHKMLCENDCIFFLMQGRRDSYSE
jgi:hypothetical protein